MINYVEPIRKISDIKKIIEYLRKRKFMYMVIFQIGIYSGLRISDILGLNISDVENKEEIEIQEKKTGKYKKFPINKDLQKLIKQWLKIRKINYSISKGEPLFIGKKHCRLDKSQVYREIKKACEACRLRGNYGTHTMRKTFGYHHYQKFKDIAMLQKIFNHSAPQITLRYIGLEQEEINQSYRSFDYDYEIKEPENKQDLSVGIIKFLKDYLNNGGQKHREFAELALASC